jgi:hypothetical protein
MDEAFPPCAEAYRRRAEQIRTEATGMEDRDAREAMYRLAANYERLAENVERATERPNRGRPTTYPVGRKPRLVFKAGP